VERRPVSSSHLAAVGYDPAAQKMQVEFSNGAVYEYRGVPAHTHEALMNANSAGEHFVKHIKNAFNGKRVSE
jgi:hypothetical protein